MSGWPYRGDSNVGFGHVPPRRNKFSAKRTVIAGHSFASKAEGARYADLVLLEAAGKIVKLDLQPRFPLVVNGIALGHYTADFRYLDVNLPIDRNVIVEDVKGYDTRDGKLRRRLAEALHGIRVTLVTRSRK